MNPDQVQQIIDAVKSASPALLAAARHHVAAQVQIDLMWMTVLIAVAAFSAVIMAWMLVAIAVRPRVKYEEPFLQGVIALVAFLFAVGSLIGFLVVRTDYIQLTQAPDYAVVQALTDLVPGSSK